MSTGPRGGLGPQGFRGEKGPTGPTGPSIDPALFNSKAPINNPNFTGTVFGIDKIMVGLGNVNNTSDIDKEISIASKAALDLKANLNTPSFTGTVSGIDKIMVGLGNVDNTSDALKPISTKTQEALDLKANIDYVNTRTNKSMIGLGNADNTSDDLKPISIKIQSALDLKDNITEVYSKISNLVGGAPDTLNTLKELSDALGNNTNLSVSLTNSLALKASTSYVDSKINNLNNLNNNSIIINTSNLDTNNCYNITNLSDGNSTLINNTPLSPSSINGVVNVVYAIGTNIYIGGNFTTFNNNDGLGDITTNCICKYDTITRNFSIMGTGLNNEVFTLCQINSDLYIGGAFTTFNNNDGLGNVTSSGICKYNITTGIFSATMGSGFNNIVYALQAIGTDLYIGGNFTTANGISANRICKYDRTTGIFSAMGSGVDRFVVVLYPKGTDLYVGGEFTNANSISGTNRICKYDTTNSTFYAMGSGINREVKTICEINSDLYIGGAFTTFNNNDGLGNVISTGICKYNITTTKFSVGGIEFNNTINSLCAIETNLYIGGYFTLVNKKILPYFIDMKNISAIEIKYNNTSLGFMLSNRFEHITSVSYNNKKYINFLNKNFIV